MENFLHCKHECCSHSRDFAIHSTPRRNEYQLKAINPKATEWSERNAKVRSNYYFDTFESAKSLLFDLQAAYDAFIKKSEVQEIKVENQDFKFTAKFAATKLLNSDIWIFVGRELSSFKWLRSHKAELLETCRSGAEFLAFSKKEAVKVLEQLEHDYLEYTRETNADE